MSYNNVVGGKLKIKGGIPSSSTGVTKKNKKREEKQKEETAEKIAAHESEEVQQPKPAPRAKTAAELAFEKAQKKREESKVKSMAAVPYREKVDQLNKYLGTLSEHYDIPKVGPG